MERPRFRESPVLAGFGVIARREYPPIAPLADGLLAPAPPASGALRHGPAHGNSAKMIPPSRRHLCRQKSGHPPNRNRRSDPSLRQPTLRDRLGAALTHSPSNADR